MNGPVKAGGEQGKHRRSVRLKHYDYSQAGAYFVTICVKGRACLLGDIVDAQPQLNRMGEIVKATWLNLTSRHSHIQLDEFVITPNHFHGIILIVGAGLALPGLPSAVGHHRSYEEQGGASSAPTLGDIIRVFKSISTIEVNRLLNRPGQSLWQRNYYEHVIRNEDDLAAIREYILHNPYRWVEDEYHP